MHAHKSGTMSVEEKFREYKLVPDVLRVAPTEKAEVSKKNTYCLGVVDLVPHEK